MWKLATLQNGGKVPRWAMHTDQMQRSLFSKIRMNGKHLLQSLPNPWFSFLPPCLVFLPNQISSPSTSTGFILWPSQSEKQCACRHVLIIHMMIGSSLLLNHNYWSTAVAAKGMWPVGCWLNRKEAWSSSNPLLIRVVRNLHGEESPTLHYEVFKLTQTTRLSWMSEF